MLLLIALFMPCATYVATVCAICNIYFISFMTIYTIADGKTYTCDTGVDGWANWQHPKLENIEVTNGAVTIGASIQCDPKGWGTLDDFFLSPID